MRQAVIKEQYFSAVREMPVEEETQSLLHRDNYEIERTVTNIE